MDYDDVIRCVVKYSAVLCWLFTLLHCLWLLSMVAEARCETHGEEALSEVSIKDEGV